MPKRKVNAAFIRYKREGQRGITMVRRGSVHDFPQEVVDKYADTDYLVSVDQELPRIGTMEELPTDANDERVVAWIMSATFTELQARVDEANENQETELLEKIERLYPTIVGFETVVADDGDDIDVIGPDSDDAPTSRPQDTPSVVVSGHAALSALFGTPGDAAVTSDEDDEGQDLDEDDDTGLEVDQVVKLPLNRVGQYLEEHPDKAREVLDAEFKRTQGTGEEPRVGLTRLVQTIVGHTE